MAEPRFDPESVDRAFAEMVAGYHLTSDRPDPVIPVERPLQDQTRVDQSAHEQAGHEQAGPEQPSARFEVPPPGSEPGPTAWRVERSWAEDHPLFASTDPPPRADRVAPYVPEPLPPLARPGLPSLVGWLAVGFAALVVLAAGLGLDLPAWVGWLAVGSFITGFGVLLTQLPRHRPPDAGDGAVL